MAANRLNIDEAKERIVKIGTIVTNLGDALVVIRSFSKEIYDETGANFVSEISAEVESLNNIVKSLQEGHGALSRAFDKYADEHSAIAARL